MLSKPEFNFGLAVETFYDVLFKNAPEVEAMFSDTSNHATMMIVALQSIGEKANQDRFLADYMTMLGSKHKGYGLTTAHMKIGRAAFEQAIEVGCKTLSSDEKAHYLQAFTNLELAMGFDMSGQK